MLNNNLIFCRRKNALILRTQLTVRVHAVIGKYFILFYNNCFFSQLTDVNWVQDPNLSWNRRDRMVVGFTTTYAINVYHHNIVSSNPANVKFVSDLRQTGFFHQ
jgi:hypothetical protein